MGGRAITVSIGGEFLMADYLTTDTELTSIADAIRVKGGTTASLTYPSEFISAINAIETTPPVQDKTISPTEAK